MAQRTRNSRTGRFQPSHHNGGSGGFLNAALGIAGGIGVGAALMYLLDPNQGEDRRHHLAEKTSHLAHNAWDTIGEHASEAGSLIASAAPMVGEKLREQAHRAGATADEASEAASGWLQSARSRLPSLPHFSNLRQRVSSMNPLQRRSVVGPMAFAATSAGLTALVIGATAMYLFDPDRGRGRRAWLGQKASHAVRETGHFMRATGRHLANKGQGYYHQTSAAARDAMDSAAERFGSGGRAEEEQGSQVPSI